jgi:hypothetical protein
MINNFKGKLLPKLKNLIHVIHPFILGLVELHIDLRIYLLLKELKLFVIFKNWQHTFKFNQIQNFVFSLIHNAESLILITY